jgi:precorrin-6B methylase 2
VSKLRIVMTLLVRDEVDVVEAMLNGHFALGVDFVIATDNRSIDGTTAVLERYQRQGRLHLIHEPDDDYQQGRWVTRMARMAAVDHDADWVINADADEFWWPRAGDLRSTLAAVPATVTAVAARRYNFVPRPDDGRPFHERMRWRRTDSLTHDGTAMGVKVCHRAHPRVELAVGNHSASGLPGARIDDGGIDILHFPLRSYAQHEGKIRRSATLHREEAPADAWSAWVYDDDRLRAAVEAGELVEDLRVSRVIAAAPDRAPGPPAPPRPPEAAPAVGRVAVMSEPEPAAVDSIGDGVSYADGAEDEVLAVLRAADDVSSGSPELARHMVDWPTRYHFSYQRVNLLRPLDIRHGMRVLDAGAGSGALSRYLGEQGADVVAVEGNPARAAAIAVRCADLPNVEVVAGALDDFDRPGTFDLVLLVGVLEYAGADIGGAAGAPAMLRRARSQLRPGGAVVVAIENQLGLKYLLGAREDHVGRPWVGIEGYAGRPGVRTWSRRALGALLAAEGLDRQHWLAPFPDYKLPSVVVDQRLYAQPDAADLLDQIVLQPVVCLDQPPVRLADAAGAHRVFADAGLAADVANSFLVVASAAADPPHQVVRDDALAWLFGGHRLPPWRRSRLLTVDRELVVLDDGERRQRAWLTQEPGRRRPFHRGRTLGEQALAAVRRHDEQGLRHVLVRWRDELDRRAVDVEPPDGDVPPFLLADSKRGLPDGHLDASLSNFVESDGQVVLIDDEWRTGHPVDVRVAEFRALWVLAREVVTLGIEHPWGDWATVDDIVARLADLAGVDVDPDVVEGWREAEVQLQLLVAGEPRERLLDGWLSGALRSVDLRPDRQEADELRWLRGEAVPRLTAALAERDAEVDALRRERAALAGECDEYRGQRDHYEGVIAAQRDELERLRRPRGFVGQLVRRQPMVRRVVGRVRRSFRR